MLEIAKANLARADHAEAVVALIDMYSRDPLANDAPLADAVKRALVPGLVAHGADVFIAFGDGRPIGIAVCFRGFSTFAARPLINVHDMAVDPAHRGVGVGRALMNAIEAHARALGCCKITLEVQEHNARARRLYVRCGFSGYELASAAGSALFWQKTL